MKSFEDAVALVVYLRKEGVSFYADEQNIRVHPAGLLIPEHRDMIKAHKPALVAWLRKYAADMGCDGAAKHWRKPIP